MSKGRYTYIPPEMDEELRNTKSTYNITKQSEAFRKMIEDLRIGRELRQSMKRRY